MTSAYDMITKTFFTECKKYDPDNIFKRFEVIKFPVSLVGLTTEKSLDVEVDLNVSAYLKTMHDNKLLKFEDAREVSAAHRAYNIKRVDNHTIQIKFTPKNECISKMKQHKQNGNRFIFDLRLIQVDGVRCCNDENHSEIGRYYICGEFEYFNITHQPNIVDFGDVVMKTKSTKYVRIRNDSQTIAVNIKYVRVTGYEVLPDKFTIPPNSSKRIAIVIKPICLKVGYKLNFQIRNPHDVFNELTEEDENYLPYSITVKANVIYNKKPKDVTIESLHKLSEQHQKYTYLDEELTLQVKRKEKANIFLETCKNSRIKNTLIEKYATGRAQCENGKFPEKPNTDIRNFCKPIIPKISSYELFDIVFHPFAIDFGRVGLSTHGRKILTIQNKSKYDIIIKLCDDSCVLYTDKKIPNYAIKLKSFTDIDIPIFCYGFFEGSYEGTFEYIIDNKYNRKHPYFLYVGNPNLMVTERNLKFGMVTTEGFVTSVPLKIFNFFNVGVKFTWDEMQLDTPFEIIPNSGLIPGHSCKICDVMYVCKATKTKAHEVDLLTQSKIQKVIPIELLIITRKLAIKFLQPAVMFKDIALNVETIEKVKLENSSREIVLFHVVEPLIPGFRMEPMSGIIRPKTVITFNIIVKITCILEFSFDVNVKINNRENIMLSVSGNIVEPKLIIHPKHIYLSRIPCNMITYVPVTIQNLSTLKTYIEVLDTGDENIFDIYITIGNEKKRIFKFDIEGGQSKTVFVKVYDVFRREYEMFIPFKINGLLGPPDFNTWSTELHHYIGEYELGYENNPKVRLKTVNKEISYCRIAGVITVPWIQFSVDNFEITFAASGSNQIEFTMRNVSKYYLFVTILTSKLAPNFSLDLRTEENQSIINETNIKFELDRQTEAELCLKFHPKSHGKFVTTALLYLDKHMTIPYHNLTFIGKKQTPNIISSSHNVVFPPSLVGQELIKIITIKYEDETEKRCFSCVSKEEEYLGVEFIDCEIIDENDQPYTILTVELKVYCQTTYTRNLTLIFSHESGSCCGVEVNFCFTYCPLTLHTINFVTPSKNPYPYYPLPSQTILFEYLETCTIFLEKWMFQQGFHRDLYPVIPDTFHAISSGISTPFSGTKTKGMNVSFLNFVRRIAGPLMKHVKKIAVHGVDESYKCVKEIHDTYEEIINLLRSRGANLWVLQAKFLLSYEQFVIHTENVTPQYNTEIILNKELLAEVDLFNRLNKQSWIDFILQSYKVFIMDSCFFDCVCVSSQPRDIIKLLVDWYNEQIAIQHKKIRGTDKPLKLIQNITTDLSDGVALASCIVNNCTFLEDHFLILSEIDESDRVSGIINNACLIIEAMTLLRLYFPLKSTDFLEPNFLQMFFLSIHLYITLPMFKLKDIIRFNPPLMRSSTRQLVISPVSQESIIFNFVLLNNLKNNFSVERAPPGENVKKIVLNVKFIANFTGEEKCILLIHGYNKTRIFDTYIVFMLKGHVGLLNPFRKCKVTGPLYRPNKVDVLVSSPFMFTATYKMFLTDSEPTIPVTFEEQHKQKFYVRRLNLIDKEVTLSGLPKESGQEVVDQKVYLQMTCFSTQVCNSWVWFRSDIGEFFIKITSQPRWDLALDTIQARVSSWPMDPCSCGESCECYRTTILVIPHRNELMLKCLRYTLLEHASEIMMQIYDQLIETSTGKLIMGMLLAEGGTNMSDIQHILRSETTYRISSRTLIPRLDHAKLAQHSNAMLALPITIPANDKSEKYTLTFTSDCGMDIRTYRILFFEAHDGA